MKISVRHVPYRSVQAGIKWLESTVSPRKYFLHNMRGGQGWRYYEYEHAVEIDDDKTAVMFALKFGCSNE